MRVLSLTLLLAVAGPAVAVSCDLNVASPQPLPVRSALVAPFAPEMAGVPQVLGASSGLLVGRRDESLAVDMVLLRLRSEACATQVSAAQDAYAGYQKKTEHDNTPWRYEGKPGQPFSVAEFDAWMKSRGVRVAKGRPASAETVAETVSD